MKPILLPRLAPYVQNSIIEWIQKTTPPWAEGAVMGMSGGIDSSVVAALTAKAFRGTELQLRAYSLPTNFNPALDDNDAKIVADMFEIPLELIPMQPLMDVVAGPGISHVAYGNMTSRMRAVILWTLAEKDKSIVMGTGNKDEDYGVGYYTLTGDGLVHLNPIGFLSKRLVRELGAELGLPERLVNREPTAGLEKDQTDFKDLGYTYEFVELVIEAMEQGFALRDAIYHRQVLVEWERVRSAGSKFGSVSEAVIDVVHRHGIALSKAELVRPKVPDLHLPRT